MMDSEILDMLEDIGRSSVARLSPAVYLSGNNAQVRRDEVLGAIRGTILPRRLEFTAADGAVLAIEVNSSRITDVFRCVSGSVPDFETEARENLTERLAQLVSEIATAPGPLELVSLRPDVTIEADDVGITLSEVYAACARIALPEEPRMTIVPDQVPKPEAQPEAEPQEPDGIARKFYESAERFALGRILIGGVDAETRCEGLCAPGQPAHPEKDLLTRFARDLAGWQTDGSDALSEPQLIVMRPTGGQGAGLAILRDGRETAAAVHDVRKLGAVVNLWKAFKNAAE
ncbi:hypothetical protein SAMN05444358_102202 [Ruegeria halocynthiae]|uniref:Uncharacterized protein n=1 Tax=Ruegeria halocynthiae TaxID=985054 RepID=A0A1H2Y9U3_9RHOB|nr:hypothetical protein [Ruegeria halocynthiae]SDX01725.1 hypothetical protein SAMN05444358_102202 [Ruegeria halocynthiae]